MEYNNYENMGSTMTYSTPDVNGWPLIKVYGCDFRKPLKEMADTVDRLEMWHWFKNEKPPDDSGYMYWGHENINMINRCLPTNEHSGATFGFAMRCMQAIAIKGFDEWKAGYDTPG